MWIKVYNLPFKGRLNPKNAEAIVRKLGGFVKVDFLGSVGIDKSDTTPSQCGCSQASDPENQS